MDIKSKKIGQKVVGGIAGLTGLMILWLWVTNPVQAGSDIKSLQDAVQVAQQNYEVSQKATVVTYKRYCEDWKVLAAAKANLSKTLQIDVKNDYNFAAQVDCSKIEVPAGF